MSAHSKLNEERLVPLARKVGATLQAAKLMAAAAESCTGGLVGHLITEVPGSSAWWAGSAGVYSYAAKETLLGVDPKILVQRGAVSPEVAAQMARGARQLYDVDVAVAITGIAGPGGGTPEKPTGLVHFHLSGRDGSERAERIIWPGNRRQNKLLSARQALEMLQDYASHRR